MVFFRAHALLRFGKEAGEEKEGVWVHFRDGTLLGSSADGLRRARIGKTMEIGNCLSSV